VNARLNIEPEAIIAWTVVSVCMYYVLEAAVALLFVPKEQKYAQRKQS
jgi:hypothetical protein